MQQIIDVDALIDFEFAQRLVSRVGNGHDKKIVVAVKGLSAHYETLDHSKVIYVGKSLKKAVQAYEAAA